MMRKNFRYLPGLLLLLAACKVGPNYRRPDAPVAGTYKEDQGWKPAVPAQVPSDEPWWAIYNDPLLDSLEKTFATVPGEIDTPGQDEYNYLGRQALASAVTAAGGFGIAKMIEKHLGAQNGSAVPQPARK